MPGSQNLQFMVQAVFGGCYQWVLDAACQAVEWLDQPLGFNSLALRSSLDPNSLDKRARWTIIKDDRRQLQYPLLKPRIDHRGFRILSTYVIDPTQARERLEWATRPRLRGES